jgi:hypothetical protein
VSADTRPIREKPINPGGMKIDGAENDVFSGGSDTNNAKLAPAPETPDAKALHSADASPPTPPMTLTPSVAPTAAPSLSVPPSSASPSSTAKLSGVANAPPAPASKPAIVANVPQATANKPAVVANAPPAPVNKALVVTNAPAAPKPTPVKPGVATEDVHQAAAGHQPMVQLAALTSEEAARQEWQQLAKRMPDLLNGRQPNYSRTERDGHTFWRVRVAGFADVAQARSFCDHVRAKSGGCSVADF